MALTDVNFVAIIVSTVLYVVLGAFWYSPNICGKAWMESCHLTKQHMKDHMTKAYVGCFILAFIIFFVLAHLIRMTNAVTGAEGALLGFWVWLGFVATTQFGSVLWLKRPLNGFFIDTVFSLILLLIGGAIIAGWR